MPFLENITSNTAYQISDNEVFTMLDIRFRDGRRVAIPYSFLTQISYDPVGSLILNYHRLKVSMDGLNLIALYEAIANHSCHFIQEQSEKYTNVELLDALVTKITIEDE